MSSIGTEAFYICTGLTEITNHATTLQVIDGGVFSHLDVSACILRVPAASVDAYRAAEGWKDFVHIEAIPVSVSGVSLNKASTTLSIGASETLIATVFPAEATNQAVT